MRFKEIRLLRCKKKRVHLLIGFSGQARQTKRYSLECSRTLLQYGLNNESQGQIHYARKFGHYALERHPQNNSIMPKIMHEKQHYARLILDIFDALFRTCRRKNTSVSLKHNIVCMIFKFARSKRQIMLKSTQNVFFRWTSTSKGYSLISLQPCMMMQRRNQALKVATKALNKLIYY